MPINRATSSRTRCEEQVSPSSLHAKGLFVGYHCRLNKLFPLGVMMGSSLSKLALSAGVQRGSYEREGCGLAEGGGVNLYWSAGGSI